MAARGGQAKANCSRQSHSPAVSQSDCLSVWLRAVESGEAESAISGPHHHHHGSSRQRHSSSSSSSSNSSSPTCPSATPPSKWRTTRQRALPCLTPLIRNLWTRPTRQSSKPRQRRRKTRRRKRRQRPKRARARRMNCKRPANCR